MSSVRWSGALARLSAGERRALLERGGVAQSATVADATRSIIARVRTGGDDALRELALELDGVALESLAVDRVWWRRALDALDPALRRAMERAARNIAAVHTAMLPDAVQIEVEPGIIIGRRPDPLDVVGVYAPGGRAAYPSSVLMGAVPARVAGVSRVILCSPPQANGRPSEVVLATAELANVDAVYAVGGAGAIAAMALGTTTIPRVDRVVGPGNAWVAEAKLQLASACAFDAPAGPSEVLVIADESADAEQVALELVAQAEHDPDAMAIALTTSAAMALRIERALDVAAATAARGDIVRASLARRGAVLWAEDNDVLVRFANEFAAEHVLIAAAQPDQWLNALRSAGTVFVGANSSVAFGDYMTGANHVLPTGGLARSYSGLSTLDFIRWTTYQRVSPSAAARLADDVATFATAEGLPGHAAAASWINAKVSA